MGTQNEYIPPKNWKDITEDEKIERLREIIKDLKNYIGRESSKIENLRNDFSNHEHSNGKIFKEIKNYNNFGMDCALKADPAREKNGEVYFKFFPRTS